MTTRSVQVALSLEVAYNCAYCGAPMYHREGLQPSTSYAECWKCWAQKVIENRDKFRRSADLWRASTLVALILGVLLGMWS